MLRLFVCFLFLFIVGFLHVNGQETLDPLNAGSDRASFELRNGNTNEIFLYQNTPQDLPIMDDFSIDRTRHLNASSTDANVSLLNTFYYLDSAGFSFDYMAYSSTLKIRTTIDTITFMDSVAIDVDTIAPFQITVADLSGFPVATSVEDVWMPWDLIDSVTAGGTTTDTVYYTADLVQDSLFVYEVSPDTRTCECAGTTKPLILWEDDDAFINGTYPVDPPTIGVASLEGLDRTGYPYDFTSTAYGVADHLTSVPINLGGLGSADSVYISFFYQPQGLSGDDVVQAQDSLFLEFYDVLNDEWDRRWEAGYTTLQPFEQVIFQIAENEYLQNGFQFRFKNQGSLAGALDHWHIDYLRLDKQRTIDDTVLVDVAYVMPESSLLDPYTSIPYNHFASSPVSFMQDTVYLDQKNLDVNDRFITYGMRVGLDGEPVSTYDDFPGNGTNTMNNADSTFVSAHPINAAPNNYIYPVVVAPDTCAFWRSQFYTNATPDINRCNDTITFVQELSNYYAYDDGSAEAGYNLNVSGAKLAYRFDMPFPDTLRAVRMYFDPIFEDPSSGSFLITIWSDLSPETIIHQNVSFSSPEFRLDGVNKFVEYELDSLIPVPNQFFVGWVQTSSDKMDLGFDRNRNNNDRIFYNVSTIFAQSSFEGSLMMRPVFANYKDPFLGFDDTGNPFQDLTLYPNPAHEYIRFEIPGGWLNLVEVRIMDALGKVVKVVDMNAGDLIPIQDLGPGRYHVMLLDADGHSTARPLIVSD